MTRQIKPNATILMIDDSETETYELLQKFSTTEGYELGDLIKNGKDGIAKAKETKPDFVFIDHSIPDMDSVELVRQIKQILPHSIIIVMSISADGGFLRAIREARADKFISKPFRFDDLHFVFGSKA